MRISDWSSDVCSSDLSRRALRRNARRHRRAERMRGTSAMTNSTDLAALAVGDTLPAHTQGPINRATLALFAGASNDYLPLHIDSDFAKAAGMDDFFGPGMPSMAYPAPPNPPWVPPGPAP